MLKDETPFNILIAEDNSGDYLLIAENLKEKIALPQITHVENFAEAKAMLLQKNAAFDVVLLDLSLPDKNGEELIDEIVFLSHRSPCPVIVLTGFADISFSKRSLARGVADYLVKDEITASMLYKSIVYSLERMKSQQQLEESERRYHSIFYQSPQPMWMYDIETFRFVQVNKAAKDFYGYSEDEFLSMTILDIRPEEDKSHVIEKARENRLLTKRTFSGHFRHIKKSGELIHVDIYSSTISVSNIEYRSVIAIDVTEKYQFEQKLTRAIIKTQEEERYEIGGELHDNVCQILASSQIMLGMLKSSLPESSLKWHDQCKQYINMAAEEIRNLSHRLAPAVFDDSTLEVAFANLLNTFNAEKKYIVSLYFDPAVHKKVTDQELQLNMYRILQEQVRNIVKYAKATTIDVEVTVNDDSLKMIISDDGIGFDIDAKKDGIGFVNMKRRAELFSGSLLVNSAPNQGCTLEVEIPVV